MNTDNIKFNNDNLIIVDKGRAVGEKSVLLIENNEFKGFCYTDLAHQITNIEILRKLKTEESEIAKIEKNVTKPWVLGLVCASRC